MGEPVIISRPTGGTDNIPLVYDSPKARLVARW